VISSACALVRREKLPLLQLSQKMNFLNLFDAALGVLAVAAHA